ncbi:MAG: ABC transporter substrate-binding protein [Treponema sp.]|nr:ABC transporter substrate-binding protein [Treponema sp.]
MRKVIFVVLALALVTGMVFAGGGQQQQQTGDRPGVARNRATDHLVWGMGSSPVNLDPSGANDTASSQLARNIFETLVVMDENNAPTIPGLAERWVWDDPTRLRVFIRQNVRFHNNDILTANDVKFTLERAAVSPQVGHITNMINRVDVINNNEAVIVLDYPFVPFLAHLAHSATGIVNERAVREMGDAAFGRNPVGTGPMRFDSWITGVSVDLVRFDGYWGGRKALQRVTFRIIPDPSTRQIALETGEIDVNGVAAQDVPRVLANPNLQVYRRWNLATEYIGYNMSRTPFNDVRVRQAINYALDKEVIARVAYPNVGRPTAGPINTMVWGSTADQLQPFEYNQARARQLLAEAGYPNGFTTHILVSDGGASRIDAAEIAQNMLAQVGITATVRILEWGAFLDATAQGDMDMFILGWVTVTGDPDYGLHPLFHVDNFGARGNRGFYNNPRVNTLLDQGRQETNPTQRAAIYREVQQIIRDESPWIFIQAGEVVMAAHPAMRGFEPTPVGSHDVFNVYFEW